MPVTLLKTIYSYLLDKAIEYFHISFFFFRAATYHTNSPEFFDERLLSSFHFLLPFRSGCGLSSSHLSNEDGTATVNKMRPCCLTEIYYHNATQIKHKQHQSSRHLQYAHIEEGKYIMICKRVMFFSINKCYPLISKSFLLV